jgi:hypothetical protein
MGSTGFELGIIGRRGALTPFGVKMDGNEPQNGIRTATP